MAHSFFSTYFDHQTPFKAANLSWSQRLAQWIAPRGTFSAVAAYAACISTFSMGYPLLTSFGWWGVLGLAPLSYLGFKLKEIGDHVGLSQRHQRFLNWTHDLEAPSAAHPWVKSKHQSFNHTHSFLFHEGMVWFAPRIDPNHRPHWQPLFMDDFPYDADEIELQCDGANLMVRVNERTLFYRKIITESFDKDYQCEQTCHLPQAKHGWFTLPVVSWFSSKKHEPLELSPFALWAMTHSDKYKHTINIGQGRTKKILPITSVYQLLPQGLIRLHDPFVEQETEITIPLPLFEGQTLMAKAIGATNSTVAVLGELSSAKGSKGWALMVREVDYDSLGYNPAIRYSFDPNEDKRPYLCGPWLLHPLPIDLLDATDVTLLQTGQGSNEVQVRLSGDSKIGPMVWEKEISQAQWKKTKYLPTNKQRPRLITAWPNQHLISTQPFSLGRALFNWFELFHFSTHNSRSKILLTHEQNETVVEVTLYKHVNLIKSFLGLNPNHYSLVFSPEDAKSLNLNKLAFDACLHQSSDGLTLQCDSLQLHVVCEPYPILHPEPNPQSIHHAWAMEPDHDYDAKLADSPRHKATAFRPK